ncbi:MAG: hypothetical protein JWO30_303 [Fibrobacteres bacterium]|nr:hypothetical protein [Fibrobacterota bacterium]
MAVQSTTLVAIAALFFVATSWSAPRKSTGPGRPPAPSSRAPAETVYVPVTPPAAPVQESRAAESAARENDSRRREAAASTGPLRPYAQAFGMNVGFYAAEILGSSPYANIFWDLYPESQAFFFQFSGGGGPAQSAISQKLRGGDYTSHSYNVILEALGGYSVTGLTRGDGRSGGLFPYFVAGITAVWQGGNPNIGAVGGFGNRMNLPFMAKNSPFVLNYAIHDQVYSEKFNSDPALTQNFVLLLGVQKYF